MLEIFHIQVSTESCWRVGHVLPREENCEVTRVEFCDLVIMINCSVLSLPGLPHSVTISTSDANVVNVCHIVELIFSPLDTDTFCFKSL